MRLSQKQALAAAGLLLDGVVREVPPMKAPPAPDDTLAKPNVFGRTLVSAAGQLPAYIRYRSKTEEELQRSVPKRIAQMVRQYWGFDPMPPHIQDWEDDFKGGRQGRLRPTEHGKSTGHMVVFPIISLAENPNGAHIIVSGNRDDAGSWMGSIDRFLSGTDPGSAEFLRDYPWCAKPPRGSGKKWNTREITVVGRTDSQNRNPSIYATGRGDKSIRGRRGKTVFDDLEGLGTVTELEREALWNWLTQEAIRTLEDPGFAERPLWLVQGTPFDVDSVYYRLEEIAGIAVNALPYKYPDDHPTKPGQLWWPAKRAKIEEFRQMNDPRIFAIAMELNPKVGREEAMGYKELLTMGHALKNEKWTDAKIYVSLDPASGSRKKGADYAGISVVRIRWPREAPAPTDLHQPRGELRHFELGAPPAVKVQALPEIELLFCEMYRFGLYEQVHRVAYLADYYGCPAIIEGNAHQQYSYGEVFEHLHPETKRVIFMSTEEKKRDPTFGMSIIKTLYRHGRFHTVEPLGQDTDEGMKAFRREVRDMENARHLHICSSVWFVIRHTYEGPRSAPSIVRNAGPQPEEFRARTGYGGARLGHVINVASVRARMGG